MIKTIFTLTMVLGSLAINAQVTVQPVLGTQTAAILPFDYAEDGLEIPISEINEGLFTSSNSVKAFYDEISYGKMTFSGTVFPYRTNLPPLYGVGYTNCYPIDSIIVNQPDVDYSIIDNIVLFVHDTSTTSSCSAGVSSSDKLPFTTDDGPFLFRRSGFRTEFYFPSDFSRITSSTVAHELMHSIGNDFHSNSYIKDNGEWTLQGYGNVFDILGLRSQASHPCSVIKHKLGWLTENEIHTVTQSDTFRVYPLEQNLPNQTQALIIELPNSVDLQPNDNFQFDRLYLEYRGLTGFDERSAIQRRVRLTDNSFYPNTNIHGLSVIGVDCNFQQDCLPMLIDMHPDPIGGLGASYLPHEASDAPLLLNETYTVPDNDIEIKVINVNQENYIDVVINWPEASTDEANPMSEINLFPNPVTNKLFIDNPKGKHLFYTVYDMQGKQFMSGTANNFIDISTLPEGVFMIRLTDTFSKNSSVERIVKM
jgi:hypothetical protein